MKQRNQAQKGKHTHTHPYLVVPFGQTPIQAGKRDRLWQVASSVAAESHLPIMRPVRSKEFLLPKS